jgi:hypothetical protein
LKRYILLLFLSFSINLIIGQSDEDALFIKKIHDNTLSKGKCYNWLDTLCNVAPGRLAGSKTYPQAENYMAKVLKQIGVDNITYQECNAPVWTRGDKEQVVCIDKKGINIKLRSLALGNSIGTKGEWISAEVIEVTSLDEVERRAEEIKGKIVFYNRPMDPTHIRTFNAYGGAVDQRVWGASTAAKYGAIAVLVRSMTTLIDTFPHTGTLVYKDSIDQIPGLAISTVDAENLSNLISSNLVQSIKLKSYASPRGTSINHNIIGEIKGSEYPNEIILVGGHLDAWDVGRGAHDDGAGCVHALQVLQNMRDLNYVPKRTIRCVLFANEENGLAGGKEYFKISEEKGEYHLAALESDSGGFVPRGFSFEGTEENFKSHYQKVSTWLPLLEAYDLAFKIGGSGADIGPLKPQNGLLIGLRVDSQRYFDYHHTSKDVIGAVNQRELELGAAAMSSLVYLIDKHGLN